MQAKQIGKSNRQSPLTFRNKMVSQQLLKNYQEKQKQEKKQKIKNSKKVTSRQTPRQNQQSFKNSLFNSVQQLPQKSKQVEQMSKKKVKKQPQPIPSYTKIQETTLSRETKLKTKQYLDPNGQYFGIKNNAHSHQKMGKNSLKKLNDSTANLSKSVENKIKQLHRIQKLQQSESESLKSEISEQEMRRLKKIHSLQKQKIMQEIVGLELKIYQKRQRI